MESKEIPAELLQEIERRAIDKSAAYKIVPQVVNEIYLFTAKYWVSRMLAEREAMEKALEELSIAAGLFAAKQNLGGNMKEARERLTSAQWEADKVLTSMRKVADQNERARRKGKNPFI